ncbi:hypothetical protein AS9A_0514 [Hoyosella subflava DQS3-9A1]|uniref:Uncharacterized protein n=1 Tax=Hoyosella subflava (strain DSM 45089 / JCM 17490 / NBRC 109087 / DQS3-9A1) TaxID=443218 RepID=F6EIP6_HOYSD|nr:hypothetical protein AS9A_0514 [Hoyosella subflava DQS3-9A1]
MILGTPIGCRFSWLRGREGVFRFAPTLIVPMDVDMILLSA